MVNTLVPSFVGDMMYTVYKRGRSRSESTPAPLVIRFPRR
jgi:hypothetical protein